MEQGNEYSGVSLLIHRISDLCFKFSISILMPIFAAFVTIDVIIMRYLLNRPFTWGMEFTGLMLLGLFFLTATRCEEDDKHIRVELFYEKFQGKTKRFINLLSKVLGLLLFGPLSYQSFRLVPDMYQTGQAGIEFLLPLWPLRLVVALLSLLCFLRLLFDLVNMSKQLIKGVKS